MTYNELVISLKNKAVPSAQCTSSVHQPDAPVQCTNLLHHPSATTPVPPAILHQPSATNPLHQSSAHPQRITPVNHPNASAQSTSPVNQSSSPAQCINEVHQPSSTVPSMCPEHLSSDTRLALSALDYPLPFSTVASSAHPTTVSAPFALARCWLLLSHHTVRVGEKLPRKGRGDLTSRPPI